MILKVGAAAGAAASVLGVLAGMKRKRAAAEKMVARHPSNASMLVQILMQVVAPFLLPKLQQVLQRKYSSFPPTDTSINL